MALGTEYSGGKIRPEGPRREAGRSRGGGQVECRPLSSTPPSPRSPQWWRPSKGLAAAGLAPLSVRRGARAARCAEPREAEGAEAVATLSRVCSGSSRGGRGRLFPPALREQTRRRPSVPRGFLQTSARVSGGRGPRAAPEECGRAVPCAFSFLTSSGGRLPIFRNSLSAVPGILGAGVTLGLPPSLLPPRPADLGRLPRGHPRPPLAAWYSQLASGRPAGLGPGVGGGPVPARKLESFVLRPAPTGEGRRGGSGGCAGEASGGLGPGSGLGWGPGFLPAFQSVQLFGVPLGAQNWSFLFPHGSV